MNATILDPIVHPDLPQKDSLLSNFDLPAKTLYFFFNFGIFLKHKK